MFHYLWVLTFSRIVLDIQIWTSFDPILEWRQKEESGMGHNIIILKNWFQKSINNLEKTMVFLLQLEYNLQIWPLFGTILTLWGHKRIVKFPDFGKMTRYQIFNSKNIHGSKLRMFYCCLVAIYCFETALKNFGKWR